ncbi:hypothetical protein HK097_005324 [Rhizophlyctis rosea]|uniref:Uncharacterized protein n=1 Tax=Rhizophlyctis rosea TaxID=64517 RepID=A0AAD5SJ83_9FUNG|nr:hypothetical protein HK097_005324 [Rhizophlyctis rosea]
MSGPRIATRLFSTSSRALNPSRPTNPSNPNDPLQAVKNAAKAFKADGKIGEKFTEKGSIGGTIEREVGGPFSSKGAIGKQFTEKGAVGSTGQRVAENVEDKAREQQRRRP